MQLTILGAVSGAKDFNLKSLISAAGMDDVATHHPPVNAPELAGWYRSADVVVMPSYSESFGLVALEAQACGTPVLATKVGGLSRAVQDGRTGMLIEGHKAGDWADALEALFDDAQTRNGHGARCRDPRPGFRLAAHRRHNAGELPHRREPVFWKPDHPGGPHALNRTPPLPAPATPDRDNRRSHEPKDNDV